MPGLLLDTCAVIWIGSGQSIRKSARARLEEAFGLGSAFVSPFSAWELGMLTSKGRLSLAKDLDAWLETFMVISHAVFAPLPVTVLTGAHFLPGSPPNDPADRILIATARQQSYAIVTRDQRILDYGAEGFVQTVAC